MSIETHAGRKGHPPSNGRQCRSPTGKSQLLSMAEALSRLTKRRVAVILVIRHRHGVRRALQIALVEMIDRDAQRDKQIRDSIDNHHEAWRGGVGKRSDLLRD